MAYTTIDDPSAYFQTKLYTGTGSSLALTNDGNSDLQPDFVWIKPRNEARGHHLFDAVRGVGKSLVSNETNDEESNAQTLTAFGSDGFTVGTSNDVNKASNTHVAWQWKAGGSPSSNTDGSITSSVSVNQTAGISIGTFTGTASVGTVGHGLNAVPSMIINRTITSDGKDWMTYHHKNTSAPETDYLALNSTNATADFEDVWNDTAPTSSVFTIGNSSQNNTGSGTSIFYAFAEKKGFSKFGSYTGNGNADGTFVYTGFKPAWVMAKKSNSTGNWVIVDTKRDGYNGANDTLQANVPDVESGGNRFDIVSNGFKARSTSSYSNTSGDTFIYMAFAEEPLVGDNPATAR